MTQRHYKALQIGWILAVVCLVFAKPALAQEGQRCGTESGRGCAPAGARVDLAKPSFSEPTTITNPLFPISALDRVLLFGTVGRLPFRTETTLLPDTHTIEWEGQEIEALVSQYVAFLDNRIQEVALDWYAQADDGSVWYLGEEVFNYEEGVVADTEGSWTAGVDGPAAMIMPADPQVGDVYRPENAPGLVFEEVTVLRTGQTVHGPRGPVESAITVEELHMDGGRETKVFAPGYGEFLTGAGGELEAVALAVPADTLIGAPPAEVETLYWGALDLFDRATSGQWAKATTTLDALLAAWEILRIEGAPAMLDARMSWALVELVAAIDARQPAETRQAAIHVARAALDLRLQYRSVAEIDLALFALWSLQVLVDATAEDAAAIRGDAATLEWIRDRFIHTIDDANAGRIDARLDDLRDAAQADNPKGAADAATSILGIVTALDQFPERSGVARTIASGRGMRCAPTLPMRTTSPKGNAASMRLAVLL